MQEDLYHTIAVLIKILLEIVHLLTALIEEFLVVLADIALSHVVVRLDVLHLNGNDVLVVAAVENGYLATARDILVDTPEVIVAELLLIGSLEGYHLHALRVDAAEYVLDSGILSRSVQRLDHNDDALTAVCVELVLQKRQLLLVGLILGKDLLLVRLVLLAVCGELADVHFFCSGNCIFVCFHDQHRPFNSAEIL